MLDGLLLTNWIVRFMSDGDAMTGRDPSSHGYTASEAAAWEAAGDDPQKRMRITAQAVQRYLAERRTKNVSTAWQQLLAEYDRPWRPTMPALGSGRSLGDYRDVNLFFFDMWLLPEIELQQLSLRELEDIAATLPHGLAAVLAPEVNVVCPLLWRWLRDAQRRRLIRPASAEGEPTADTRWDLTEAGETAIALFRPLTGRMLKGAFSSTAAISAASISRVMDHSRELLGLLLAAGGVVGLFNPGTRGLLLTIAAWGLVGFGFMLLVLMTEDWWVREQRRKARYHGSVYVPAAKQRAKWTRGAIFYEAMLQQALDADPALSRIGMEPPPGYDPKR
jgi:hypothetical protein